MLYTLVTVVTGYLAGLVLEPVFDGYSHLIRTDLGLWLPWQDPDIEGFTPFRDGPVFKVMIAFLVGAGVYCYYLVQHGTRIMLSLVGARPLQERRFFNVVQEMAVAAGLEPAPGVWVVDDPSPNAFACGDVKNGSYIVMTHGLLERLDREELQAVVAHETAHLSNGDTRLMTLLFGVVRAVDLLQWIALRGLKMIQWAIRQAREEGVVQVRVEESFKEQAELYYTFQGDELVLRPVSSLSPEDRAHIRRPMDDLRVRNLRRQVEEMTPGTFVGALLAALFALAVVGSFVGFFVHLLFAIDRVDLVALAIWVPLALVIVRKAVSRNREFQADMTAVALTRNPGALRSALAKLTTPGAPRTGINASLSHLCIVPLVGQGRGEDWVSAAEETLYAEWGILDREALEAVWRWLRANVSPVRQRLARLYLPLISGRFLLWALKPMKWGTQLLATHPPLKARMHRLELAGAPGRPSPA